MMPFEMPGQPEKSPGAVLWFLLVLSLGHIVLVWGHGSVYWGDHGRWMHEIERFAQGEVLYVDFTWPFPPLALWAFGVFAKVFGSTVNVLWTATSVVYLLVFLAYYRYVSTLVQRPFVLAAVLSGFLLATAYANVGAAPLPLGMYTPAAPLGLLFLLVATLACLKLFTTVRLPYILGLGVLCGLCMLTKQDFWLPALYLMAVGCGVLLTSAAPNKTRLIFGLLSSFGSIILLGTIIILVEADWHILLNIPGGFGRVSETVGRGFPSWNRITIEITASAVFIFVLLLCLVIGRPSFLSSSRYVIGGAFLIALLGCALHLFMSYQIGLDVRANGLPPFPTQTEDYLNYIQSDTQLFKGALRYLRSNLLQHLFPVMLPALLALTVATHWHKIRRKGLRNTVMLLLGLCLAARLRRQFEYVEWYNFLLEIPVYVLATQLFIPTFNERSKRGLRLALTILVLTGGYTYWFFGKGPLTRSALLTKEYVDTPKGRVYMFPYEAQSYRQIRGLLDRLDPDGKRPLFAFGFTGGFNYYLDRRNPTPLTESFRFSHVPPADVVAKLLTQSPRPFLIDNAAYQQIGIPDGELHLWNWDLKMRPNYFIAFDRPYFEQVASPCEVVADIPKGNRTFFTIYDCEP